jgi:transposase
MVNQLGMDKVQAIQQLHSQNWSQRKIAETLGVDRKAVRRHIEAISSKGTEAPTGEAPTGPETSKGTIAPTGAEPIAADSGSVAETDANVGGRSDCEPLREPILAMLELGLSAQRIYQDLVSEYGFEGSYWSVRRFVRGLRAASPLPFRRIEVEPGEEAQIDFGTGVRYLDADQKHRKCHVLRVVLSHSRKGYSEAVPRQTTENFIRVLENAFRHFGGVPRTLVIDNLKAAVTKADWFDPELNPKVVSFSQHYGTVILPTKPYTPRHKGKVERGIAYVKNNALKGKVFESLAAENHALLNWETQIADNRIHGTTKKHVGTLFEQAERQALLPLPQGTVSLL